MNIKKLINDTKTKIVDVRTEEEFSEGNVPGSINIPLHEIVTRVEELKAMQPLVLCCLSGNRSGQATGFLQAQGCDQVYNGGAWEMVDSQKNK